MPEKSESISIKYNPYEMVKFEQKTEAVKDLCENYKKGIYFPDKMQRSITAWSLKDKQDYIISIVNELNPASVILLKVSDDRDSKYYIHDGLQRIEAINQFKKGAFHITLDIDESEEGKETSIIQTKYYYKATKPKLNERMFTTAQQKHFDNAPIQITYSAKKVSEKDRRALFLNIQKGVPVSEYTLYKSTNRGISNLVFDFIKDTSEENKEVVREFQDMYNDDLYFKILSDLCVYLNDPDLASSSSLKYYNDNTRVDVDMIKAKLLALASNFDTFINAINTYMDPIPLTTALIWYTEIVNKPDNEFDREFETFGNQIEKLKSRYVPDEWDPTERYESHLQYLKRFKAE